MLFSHPLGPVRTEQLGAVTTGTKGTTYGPISPANTKHATWVLLGTSTFSYDFVVAELWNNSTGADWVIDFGWGDGTSGGTTTFLPDLRMTTRAQATYPPARYQLPAHVPKGQGVYVRGMSTGTAVTVDALLRGFSRPMTQAPGLRVVALYTPQTSRGRDIDPGTTIDTPGAWVEMTTTGVGAPAALTGMFLTVGPQGLSIHASQRWFLDVGVGPSGSQVVLWENIPIILHANYDVPTPAVYGPWPCDIPQGTAIWGRLRSNAGGSDRLLDLGLWGLTA